MTTVVPGTATGFLGVGVGAGARIEGDGDGSAGAMATVDGAGLGSCPIGPAALVPQPTMRNTANDAHDNVVNLANQLTP